MNSWDLSIYRLPGVFAVRGGGGTAVFCLLPPHERDADTELLELVNMHVDHAWNGEEAVERYMESAPGTYMAVLMDVQMPGMNGYEAAKAIRAQKSSRPDAGEIPIYAMTANAYTEDISAALNAGMNGHIAKPVDTVALYRLLKKSMEETE